MINLLCHHELDNLKIMYDMTVVVKKIEISDENSIFSNASLFGVYYSNDQLLPEIYIAYIE